MQSTTDDTDSTDDAAWSRILIRDIREIRGQKSGFG
jgi:hypothetical protein